MGKRRMGRAEKSRQGEAAAFGTREERKIK